MAAAISKEATLSEVLAEVSILDVGAILKRSLAGLGCLAIFFLVVAGLDAGTTYALPDFHPPSWGIWLFWLAIGWGWLASVTEGKSYHHWEYGWYFPKLRWWASLLFAVYLLGGIKLFLIANSLNYGIERTAVVVGIWLYLMPFFFFWSILEVGHNKLMQKRRTAAGSAPEPPQV